MNFLFTALWPRSGISAPEPGAGLVGVAPDGDLRAGPDVAEDGSIAAKANLLGAILSAPPPTF